MEKLGKFLGVYGTLILAFLALIQPWTISLWKRYIRKGRIEIYETGNIEVGYSSFGPTIGLIGTLRCIHRDIFINSIGLEVVRQKDGSKHMFEWGLFRDRRLTSSGGEEASFELPSGFMLLVSAPKRYDILFFDPNSQSDMRPHINGVRDAWVKFTIASGIIKARMDTPSPVENIEALGQEFEKFQKKEEYFLKFPILERLCYWDSGRYAIRMTVRTVEQKRSYEKEWFFDLSDQDAQLLRLNVVKILMDTCERPSYYQYHFAFPKYEAKI